MNKKWKGSISEISENLSEVIGKTYGGLTILEVIDSFDGKEIKRTCKCQCSCGNITYRKFPEALYGSYRKKYCCPQKKSALKTARKLKDYSHLVGKTFGELTILEICEPQLKSYSNSKYKQKIQICRCRCSCGKIFTARVQAVIRGETKSCGHASKKHRDKNFTFLLGTKLGRLNILSVANLPEEEKMEDRTEYVCKCECGFKLVLSINDIATKTLTKCPMCQEDFISKVEDYPPAQKNQNGFGLKNISWSEKEQHFVISAKRGNRYFKARATSLDEAIEKRKELLKEADEFAKTLN